MPQLARAAVFGILLLTPLEVAAGYRVVPMKELVSRADVAVIGVLSDVRRLSENEGSHFAPVVRTGTITVQEVVFGHAELGQTLRLDWSEFGGEGPAHEKHVGLRCVWLLKRHSDDSFRANYPWDVVRLCNSDLRRVRKRLAEVDARDRDDRFLRFQVAVKRRSEYKCSRRLW